MVITAFPAMRRRLFNFSVLSHRMIFGLTSSLAKHQPYNANVSNMFLFHFSKAHLGRLK